VALLKLIRLRKVRFSCLFSLSAALCAVGAAWVSAVWLDKATVSCQTDRLDQTAFLSECFAAGWLQLIVSAIGGLLVLLLIGLVLLKFSSWKDRNWLTTFAERLELGEPKNIEE
jgi:hypothetical protein